MRGVGFMGSVGGYAPLRGLGGVKFKSFQGFTELGGGGGGFRNLRGINFSGFRGFKP